MQPQKVLEPLTGYGQLFDEVIHARFSIFIQVQGDQYGRIA